MHDTSHIEIILRAVIVKDDKILLCQTLGRGNYYLPGGHLEKGEKMDDCLKRELKEEADVAVKSMRFLEIKENFYDEHHEINIIYQTELIDEDYEGIICQEDHFIFEWVGIAKLNSILLLPENIKDYLLQITTTKLLDTDFTDNTD